jgi:oligosaccharide reducing-end xylanase
MRQRAKTGIVVLSTAALLTGPATTASAEGPAATRHQSTGVLSDQTRTSSDRVYPNVFAETGYPQQAITDKVNAAWQQLFHGTPGTEPARRDGQTVYYQLAPDMAYVEDIANRDVRTEGMGFAMMIAVQLDHQREFDSLWNFAKTKMQIKSGSSKYFFAWHTDPTGKVLSTGVAPDGDQWIAAALAFAAGRWGNGQGIYDYQREARQILHAMWHQSDSGGVDLFDRRSHLPVFSPPSVVTFTDPSYCLPAFYKVFAEVDPSDKELWDQAYLAAQRLLQKAADPKTGLVPDQSTFDGKPYLTPGTVLTDDAYSHTFQEDAWRAIANANVDAAWFGTQPWQTQYSNTLLTFFESQGIFTHRSRYHLDGTPVVRGQNTYEPAHAEGLVAMNSTAAISATHSSKLVFVRAFWNTAIPSGYARYYDGLLYLLGLLYDSGNFRIW